MIKAITWSTRSTIRYHKITNRSRDGKTHHSWTHGSRAESSSEKQPPVCYRQTLFPVGLKRAVRLMKNVRAQGCPESVTEIESKSAPKRPLPFLFSMDERQRLRPVSRHRYKWQEKMKPVRNLGSFWEIPVLSREDCHEPESIYINPFNWRYPTHIDTMSWAFFWLSDFPYLLPESLFSL